MANEHFSFFDVNSLYPFIALQGFFPVGDTIRIIGHMLEGVKWKSNELFYNDKRLFGIAHVIVYTPQVLDKPILQIKVKDQAKIFALCKICARSGLVDICKHTKTERSWDSSYTIEELEYAYSLGYDFFFLEIWNFEKQEQIFKEFFQLLAREKLISSPIPNKSHELDPCLSKEDYCDEINSFLNLKGDARVNPTDLHVSPKRRHFVKQLLNSLLGKFAQRSDKQKIVLAKHHSEIVKMFNSGFQKIRDVNLVNADACLVTFEDVRESNATNLNANSIIYGLVTARSRIFMHKAMLKLEKKENAHIFGISTDSIAFSYPRNKDPNYLLGIHFGQFKREYENISTFLSLAPKNYGVFYNPHNSQKFISKISGLTMNFQIQKSLNQGAYKNLVDNFLNNVLQEIPFTNERRNCKDFNISYKKCTISLRNNIFKNRAVVRVDGKYLCTKPYGYNEI